MKKACLLIFLFLLISITGCSAKPDDASLTGSREPAAKTDNLNIGIELPEKKTMNIFAQPEFEDLIALYDQAVIKTNFGDIKVKFYNDESPMTVNNFFNLAKTGFYNGTKFHRVIADFMIQGGDPNSKDDDWSNDGMGGPGYKFNDEFNDHKLVRGSLAMANSGSNTNGSQFFIVTAEATSWLDGRHTNFGEVVEGMDVVDKIEAVEKNENDHPLKDAVIASVELIGKK